MKSGSEKNKAWLDVYLAAVILFFLYARVIGSETFAKVMRAIH